MKRAAAREGATPGAPGRREQVLDAAVHVLGTAGPRGFTHRAVDIAAQAPAGSTSNYFRTREALIDAVVDRLEALDVADWEGFAALPRPPGPVGLAHALARFVAHASGPTRTRTLARYALFLEAAHRPAVREPLAAARARLLAWGTEWLRDLGTPDADQRCAILLDQLEGMVLHRVTFPDDAGAAADAEPRLLMLLNGWGRPEA